MRDKSRKKEGKEGWKGSMALGDRKVTLKRWKEREKKVRGG